MGHTLADYIVLGLGGFFGVNARYLVATWAAQRWGADYPYGTLMVNVAGSFVLGLFLSAATGVLLVDPRWRLFFAVGFLGAFTTFSTYTYESIRLAFDAGWGSALASVLLNNLASLLACVAGIALGRIR
jgi:CrcB protein